MSIRNTIKDWLVSPDVVEQVKNLPSPPGDYGYDPWGLNHASLEVAFSLLRNVYEKYFRVEAYGLENVPAEGRLLLIGNHSGQLPIDALLIGMAIARRPEGARVPRAMVERFIPRLPFLGNALNSIGSVVGDPVNCERMLQREEAIVVFPEGVRGVSKTYDKRYQLQRFSTGFMHIALRTNTPIVPVGVVGCEEMLRSYGNLKSVAKLFGAPALPLMLPVPLPTKVIIHYGEPIHFSGPAETESEVADKVKVVKAAVNELVQAGLQKRESVFAA